MESLFFPITNSTLTHSYQGTVVKLSFKKALIKGPSFEMLFYGATQASALIYWLAYSIQNWLILHNSG